MNIGELCNRVVIVVQANEPITTVAELMRQHHVGSAVVVEGPLDARRPIGMVTDRDIVLEVVARGLDPKTVPASEVMTKQLWSAREDEAAEDVLAKLGAHGVRRVPVVDAAGVLQGIFATDDFIEWVKEQLASLARVSQRGLQQERVNRPVVR
jgi:CBS domain-containing protein